MMAALLFEPFLFLLLNFWWAFFFSSIAAGLKCGCVDLCVSYISMWPSSSPVPVRRHLEERLTTVFNAIDYLICSCHIPNGRRCRFVFNFSRCPRFFFVFLYIWASFSFRRPFYFFAMPFFLFHLPVLRRRYLITGAVIFILASLPHVYSGVFNMNLCAVMMRFLYNNALIIMPRIYCFLAARSLSGSYIKW